MNLQPEELLLRLPQREAARGQSTLPGKRGSGRVRGCFVWNGPNESGRIFALLATRETGINQQRGFMHKAMPVVLNAIDAAYGNGVTGNIFHPANSWDPVPPNFPGQS